PAGRRAGNGAGPAARGCPPFGGTLLMTRHTWAAGLAFVAGLFLLASVPAADPPKPDAAKTAQAMADMAIALKLADLGRQAGSPEALIAAAKLLNNVSGAGLRCGKDVEPVAGKAMTREDLEKNPPRPGTPVDESKTEPMDFSKDVKALLDDAK